MKRERPGFACRWAVFGIDREASNAGAGRRCVRRRPHDGIATEKGLEGPHENQEWKRHPAAFFPRKRQDAASTFHGGRVAWC